MQPAGRPRTRRPTVRHASLPAALKQLFYLLIPASVVGIIKRIVYARRSPSIESMDLLPQLPITRRGNLSSSDIINSCRNQAQSVHNAH